MKQYVEYNITKKSMATIEYVLKMASSIMETIIFMFMGLTTVSEQQTWNTGFVIVTLLSCLIYRAIGLRRQKKTSSIVYSFDFFYLNIFRCSFIC